MPTPLPITDRPVRLAVVGLGQIAELVLPTYLERDDVVLVGLCDRDRTQLDLWHARCPGARATTSLDELLTLEADVVDVLVPTPVHADVVEQVFRAGYHVQVQKPLARDLEGGERMLAARDAAGATLRVLEDYVFFPPLVKMRDLIAAGEIGDPVSVHMKIVATGRGGWDLPERSMRWQFEQMLDGRGMMVFDHGWHQLAVASWLFGPIRRIFAWLGRTEIVPGIEIDAPSTLVWEHENGVRAVLEISFAVDTYFHSSHYTGDERIEVTGTRGYLRTNRISAQGVQERRSCCTATARPAASTTSPTVPRTRSVPRPPMRSPSIGVRSTSRPCAGRWPAPCWSRSWPGWSRTASAPAWISRRLWAWLTTTDRRASFPTCSRTACPTSNRRSASCS
jgi:predicted dehydrogenase